MDSIYNGPMNKFEKALEEIKKDYPVRQITKTYAQIEFQILFDSYNFIFIGILFENDDVLLTDFAEYAQICPWEDKDIPDLEKICQKHHLVFKNYHIECPYRSNQDIKNFLDTILELRKKYVNF